MHGSLARRTGESCVLSQNGRSHTEGTHPGCIQNRVSLRAATKPKRHTGVFGVLLDAVGDFETSDQRPSSR